MVPITLKNTLSSSTSSESGSSGRTLVDSSCISKPHKSLPAEELNASTFVSDIPRSKTRSSSPVSIHSDSVSLIGSPLSPPGSIHHANRHHPYSRRGRPYYRRDRPTALELQFAMKSIRRNHHTDIALTDAIEGRDLFLKGLSSLSDDAVTLAAAAKHAARENIRQKIRQLGWEIQEAEYNKRFLEVFVQDERKRLNMAESDFHLFKKLLVERDLPALEQDIEYLTA